MPHKRLKSIRILLVDDETIILRLVSSVLSLLGFSTITTASNGIEAIEKMKDETFDIIITDWRMPEMEGIDLIRYIRTSGKCSTPHVPIILLTGNTGTNYILEARDAGVTEYMIKPFSAQQLVRRIKSVIDNPRSFVEASSFSGPNRRFHDAEVPEGQVDRRREAA